MENVFNVRSYRFIYFLQCAAKWVFVRTIVNYFHLITFCLASLAFWKPLQAIALYLLFFFLAITGTATPFPTSFRQAIRIWLNLMTLAKLKPLSESPSWIAAQSQKDSLSNHSQNQGKKEICFNRSVEEP